MTYKPYFDRTDWRNRTERELIEAARDSGHELCIALGERLDDLADLADLPDQLADLRDERDELDKRCDMLRAELNELHEALKGAGAAGDE